MRYVCCLFRPPPGFPSHSGDAGYGPNWVEALASGIRRNSRGAEVAVVTDHNPGDFDSSIDVFSFRFPERGWVSMMEMFRPDVVGKEAILLGLDTIITGSLEDIEAQKGDVIVPLDPFKERVMCNAVVKLTAAGSDDIWDEWMSGRSRFLADPALRLAGFFSEMLWMRRHVHPDGYWDHLVPGQIVSFKGHLQKKEPTDRARIVYFHGQPKPHMVLDTPWVRRHWGLRIKGSA